MKLRQFLKRINGCQREAYWMSLKLDSEKSFAFVKMVAFREIVKEFSPATLQDREAVRQRLNQFITDDMFTMKYEQEENINELIDSIEKFGDAISSDVIDYAPETKLATVDGISEKIEVCPDMLVNGRPLIIKSKKDKMKDIQWSVEAYFYFLTFGKPIVYCVKEKTMFEYDIDNDLVKSEALAAIESVADVYPSPFAPVGKAIYEKCEKCPFNKLCLFEDIDIHEDEYQKVIVSKNKNIQWTDEQNEIIENSHSGEYRVLAGAGSGKTSVLTERMIRLGKLNDPKRILALTFTKAGVEEIKHKIEKKDTDLNVEDFTVQTFNGFCAEIIEKNYKLFGFNQRPQLIDAEFQSDLVGKILDEHPVIRGMNYMYPYLTIANGCISKTIELIGRFKRRHVTTAKGVFADLIDEPLRTSKIVGRSSRCSTNADIGNCETIISVFNEYIDYCKENCLIDYEDQINLLNDYLPQLPELVSEIKGKFSHVIVDEFQDTSKEQMDIIKNYIYESKAGNSLLVCGDDSQSIYKFRDVDAKNIIEFQHYYPNVKTLKLTKNFRSAQSILDLATSVVSKSDENINKELISINQKLNGNISYTSSYNEVIIEVSKQIKMGIPLSEIAVLCSTRKECVEIHKELTALEISNVVVVGNNIKEDNQVQAMIGLAKFLDDRNTDCEANLFDLTVWLHKSDPFVFESQYVLKDYIIGEYTVLMNEYSDVDEEDRYDWFINKIQEAFPSRSKGLNVIFDREKEICDNNIYRLFDFLRGVDKGKINVYTPSEETKLDAVTITTIHASKGKEWDAVNVYAPSLNKKIVTVKKVKARKKDDQGENVTVEFDNERIRVLFVAITRAKRYLTIYHSDNLDYVINS